MISFANVFINKEKHMDLEGFLCKLTFLHLKSQVKSEILGHASLQLIRKLKAFLSFYKMLTTEGGQLSPCFVCPAESSFSPPCLSQWPAGDMWLSLHTWCDGEEGQIKESWIIKKSAAITDIYTVEWPDHTIAQTHRVSCSLDNVSNRARHFSRKEAPGL